ncbi:MAG: DUF167 domain-containing protein [Candidatus Kryptoniota bacterium]
MYLKVKVHPNSKENKISRKAEDSFEVYVCAKPVDGKANEAVMNILADFLKVPRRKVRLVRGSLSHNKIVELMK